MSRPSTFLLASVLFFTSGALGLGYELVWIRKAALVVGASQIALSTVLTAFFLGLGLGSLGAGRWLRSPRRSPLFIYGLFEIGVGLFALAFPFLFDALEGVYGWMVPLVAGSGSLLFALRFVLLFALFLPPTFLMGSTLPLLLDALVAEDRAVGSRTSFLYGLNILGAVAGVLVTSYVAIPRLGMNATSWIGGLGNIGLGLTAVVAFRALPPTHAAEAPAAMERFFPAAAFVSGFVAIGYQVLWARYFSLFQTTTVYLTALLLAVFLLALAAGSFLLTPLLRARWSPLRIAGSLQALVPLAALWGVEGWRAAAYRPSLLGARDAQGNVVPVETLELNHDYAGYWHFFSEAADATFFAPLFQIVLVVFVPVTLLGATLPALIAGAAVRSSTLRRASGTLGFWNTLGSSAGGFATGYVFLPRLGLHWTLVALAFASLGLSLAALRMAGRSRTEPAPLGRSARRRAARGDAQAAPRPYVAGYVLAAVGLASAVTFAIVREDTTWRTIRRFGYGSDPGGEQLALVEVVEGPLNTSFVFEDKESLQVGSGNVSLAVAYKSEPSTQAIQGHVPVLFYPGDGLPRHCLGICLGSGQSFGALLMYPVERLDVVDISAEIVELSLRRFRDYNHGLATDPRVRFHLDDGRHFVARAEDASYDVVSMEPPPPAADGVYVLYSLDFYRECRRVLRDGGVFMQWLPLYRVTPLDARSIVKTQIAAFPETFVVKVGRDDFMVVSYKVRPRFNVAALRERAAVFANERLVRGSRWTGGPGGSQHELASLEGVLSLILMAPEDAGSLAAPEIFRDDTQRLSYSSGDRRLLRLYEGPALSPLSFTALALSQVTKLRGYFEPPLDDALITEVSRERAASLAFFRVPPPILVQQALLAFQRSESVAAKAKAALEVARLVDGPLAKSEAFDWIENAVTANPAAADARDMEITRGIARNRLAVYADLVGGRVAALARRFPAAPLVRALEAELAAFRERERGVRAKYLLP